MYSVKKQKRTGLLALCALLVFGASVPSDALAAAAAGGGLPYEAWLEQIRNSFTGPIAFSFALIGIVVAGALLIFGGEMNAFARTLVMIVLVMAFLVGANSIMSGLFGTGAEITAHVSSYYHSPANLLSA